MEKSHKPYDWDRPFPKASSLGQLLDLDANYPGKLKDQWNKPLTQPEASFWFGVMVGCLAEGVAVLVILAIVLWWF